MLLTAQTYINKCFYNNFDATQYRYRNEHWKKSTLQVDVLASFWKSVKVNLGNFTPSRLNIDTISKKSIMAFMQVHTGASIYNFQKWNYLNTDLYERVWILYRFNNWLSSENK
jgi:hypothetical protein